MVIGRYHQHSVDVLDDKMEVRAAVNAAVQLPCKLAHTLRYARWSSGCASGIRWMS